MKRFRTVTKEKINTVTWDTVFIGLSTVSLVSAALPTLICVFSSNKEFNPVQFPVDALHFVSISYAASLAAYNDKAYQFASFVVSGVVMTVLIVASRSYTEGWIFTHQWRDKVYQGVTEPWLGIWRITDVTSGTRDFYEMRFAFTVVCTILESINFALRTVYFLNDETFGDIPRNSKIRQETWISTLRMGIPITVVSLDAVISLAWFSPVWVVVDSKHVVLISSLLADETSTNKVVELFIIFWFALGVLQSSWGTAFSINVVATTCGSFLDYEEYRLSFRELGFGAYSFNGTYGAETATSFAVLSILKHILDLLLCSIGAIYLAMKVIRFAESQNK